MKFVPNFLSRRPILFAIVFWVLALSLAVVALNWVAMPIIAGRFAKTLSVPNVVGVPAEVAEITLRESGLNFKWANEGRYSGVIPANNVLIQLPTAGKTVKRNRTIFLTLSRGAQEVLIPDLRGASQRQAEISLQRLGLVLGAKKEGAHLEIPRGVVIRTEPESERKVRVGSRVNIVISSGNSSGKRLLPNLRETSLSRASHVLDSLGFKVGEIITLQAEDKLPNTVLELSPKPGEYLDIGTTINITIAE
ncbi:MAG: PASTA domain-containing protein [Fibromonadaceae bacterium]|nr:PASTA domain-containing protein [Fibromonadaceae bacterium]